MTIDMDAPFAEFAEKHLKTQAGSNSAVQRRVSLRWSKEQPTEPGWYWFKRTGAATEEAGMVKIKPFDIPSGDYEWAGPLRPPEAN